MLAVAGELVAPYMSEVEFTFVLSSLVKPLLKEWGVMLPTASILTGQRCMSDKSPESGVGCIAIIVAVIVLGWATYQTFTDNESDQLQPTTGTQMHRE